MILGFAFPALAAHAAIARDAARCVEVAGGAWQPPAARPAKAEAAFKGAFPDTAVIRGRIAPLMQQPMPSPLGFGNHQVPGC